MVTLLAVLLLAGPPERNSLALDPVTQRRVYEAWRAAERWSERTAGRLYHFKYALTLTPENRARYYAMQRRAKDYLRAGAAKQICAAYSIDRKALARVASDPRSRTQRFVEEPIGPDGIRMVVGDLLDMKYPTRFDPNKVVLPAKQAKEIGYANPDPDNPPKPNMAPSYMPDGRRIPGAPTNPDEEARRREIEKRAREAKIKEVPVAPQPPKLLGDGNNVKAP